MEPRGVIPRPAPEQRGHMSEQTPLDAERLRRLEPLSALSPQRLQELVALSTVEQLGMGVSVFREGDVDNQTIYLLSGDVQLTSSDGSVDRMLSARSEAARFPLDDSQPRQSSCTALSNIEIVRIDNSVLDYMMMWDQLAGVAGVEPPAPAKAAPPSPGAGTPGPAPAAEAAPAARAAPAAPPAPPRLKQKPGEWIRKMHHIMAFKNLPPANVKALLEKMERVPVKAGEVVVRQGDPGDYYYVLVDGEAEVTQTIQLATLRPGASFGEESLVTDSARNATVTMKTDGAVMRLSKQDFDALLREPMLDRIAPDDAREQVKNGAVWLDVRHASEYRHGHFPGAVNLPLHELRQRMDELDRDVHYICCCRTGHRSSAAAFLLVQQGFRASVLSGGLQVMSQDLVRGG